MAAVLLFRYTNMAAVTSRKRKTLDSNDQNQVADQRF